MTRQSIAHARAWSTRSLVCAAAILLHGCAGEPPDKETPVIQPAQPPAVESVILDAQLLAQNNQLERAASMLEDVLKREAANLQALRLLASVYAAAGRAQQSASVWERIAVLDPSDPDAAYEVGIKLARQKNWEDLRLRMLAAQSAGATDSRHYLLLGEADLELGYRTEAELYLKKAAGTERGRFLLCKLYYEQGRLAEAQSCFEEALRSNPRNFDARLHLGWLNYHRKEYSDALTHYTEAVRLRPDEPISRLSLAALLEELERPRRAIEEYKKALKLTGVPPDEKKRAYNSLTRLLVSCGRTAEAISYARNGLAEFPHAGGLYFQWGEALLADGMKSEAIERYKHAARDPVWRDIALKRIHSIR